MAIDFEYMRTHPELTGDEELSNGNVQYACTIDCEIAPGEGGQITYETSGTDGNRRWFAMFVYDGDNSMVEAPHDLPVPPALEALLPEMQTRPNLWP